MQASREYIAIDLETTGTEPQNDRITEVGCVRFTVDGVIDRYSTFVDPGMNIPYRIRLLTNIGHGHVQGAPQIGEVREQIRAFLGDAPIIGQNVSFDLNFLKAVDIVPEGPAFDTFEIGSLLLPGLPNHSLRSFADHYRIDFPVQHRALPDAEMAMQVFLALRDELAGLPAPIIAELTRLATAGRWSLASLFAELDEGVEAIPEGVLSSRPTWLVAPTRPDAVERREQLISVKPREIDQALEPTRAAAVMDEFEERREQAIMAKAAGKALSDGANLVVEAGTGVGKSIAYLLPAAIFALRNDARVVVSTDTISLQEQLIHKDVPIVRELLKAAGIDGELRAMQLKGRRNYVCLKRWAALRRSVQLTAEEARLLARLLIWLPRTETGDRSELNLTQSEGESWFRLSAEEENCIGTNCPYVGDGTCFLLRARQRAEDAHIVVVNHALLMSDVAADSRVIPAYQELIIDEAHNIEDEATRVLGFQAAQTDFDAALDRVFSRATEGQLSVVASLRLALRATPGVPDLHLRLEPLAAEIEHAAARAKVETVAFFEALAAFMRLQLGNAATSRGSESRLWITKAVRSQPDWFQVELAWGTLAESLGTVNRHVENLLNQLWSPECAELADLDALHGLAANTGLRVFELRRGATAILDRHDAAMIAWLDGSRGIDKLAVASAPLEVNQALSDRLFRRKRSTILTGATLSTEGSCDYLRGRLGFEDADELILGSPFDYERSTLVMAPTDLPEPNQPNYQKAIDRAVIDLVRASQGRALVLLTSNSAVRATRNGVREALEESEILVLAQGIDGSPRQLLQTLLQTPRSVILGSASFWEGVDITGDALSLLMMARLPFPVPTEPIYAARAELFDEPFRDFALPQAVLRFRQGFGRLIRRKSDRGVFVVLDRRIISREYGQAFLASLPRTRVVQESISTMPQRVERWLSPR